MRAIGFVEQAITRAYLDPDMFETELPIALAEFNKLTLFFLLWSYLSILIELVYISEALISSSWDPMRFMSSCV